MDPRIEKIRSDYGLGPKDVWELPQKRGTYLILHRACEDIAAKAGVVFDMPTILEMNSANGIASLIVRGTLGDQSSWSIGECSPKNNRNAYPWAMAEKRAKDRVILKLVGVHGLIYSEDEMSDIKVNDDDREFPQGDFGAGHDAQPAKSSAQLKREVPWEEEFVRELDECHSLPRLEKFRLEWLKKANKDGWNEKYRHMAQELIYRQKQTIMENMSPDALSRMPVRETLHASIQRPLDDDFPGDR